MMTLSLLNSIVMVSIALQSLFVHSFLSPERHITNPTSTATHSCIYSFPSNTIPVPTLSSYPHRRYPHCRTFVPSSVLEASSSGYTGDILVLGYEDDNDNQKIKTEERVGYGYDNRNNNNSSGGNNDNDNEDENISPASRKEIVVSASVDLPFGADVAFDAFSDLPRQPSWSSWLHSVSYVNEDVTASTTAIEQEEKEKRMAIYNSRYSNNGSGGEDDGSSSASSSAIGVDQLRQTKWVMGWKKIRFSWKSKVTSMDRPKFIRWESTSGLKNMGIITFEERLCTDQQNNGDNDSDRKSNDNVEAKKVKTRMTLTLKFIAPRIVAGLMKRSDKIASFMRTQVLRPTLIKFRDIVMVHDLGIDASLTSNNDILDQNE